MSVCRSVGLSARENSAPTGRIFVKFYVTSFSLKSVQEIKVSLISDNNNLYFTRGPIYVTDHISLSYFRMKYALDKSCRENQNTHIMSSNILSKIVPLILLCRKIQ